MEKVKITMPYRPVYPTPAALITSADENKKPNIMTAGEVFNIGLKDPCVIGIAIRKATYTHTLISRTKEFTVNLPPASLLEKVDLVGTVSGRDGLDKFSEYSLTPVPSDEIAPPYIEECPVNLECRLLSVTEVGDHDLLLGEVVAMHADADKIDDHQRLIVEKLDVFIYAEWEYFKVTEKLGHYGFSRKTDMRPR